jgi:hypothetical protein
MAKYKLPSGSATVRSKIAINSSSQIGSAHDYYE